MALQFFLEFPQSCCHLPVPLPSSVSACLAIEFQGIARGSALVMVVCRGSSTAEASQHLPLVSAANTLAILPRTLLSSWTHWHALHAIK